MRETPRFPVPVATRAFVRRRTLLVVALVWLAAARAQADFDAEVTAPRGFADPFSRVVVVAIDCHAAVDCQQVEDAAAEELASLRPGFEVVSPQVVRDELFARGATSLAPELRPAVLEKIGADGVLEIRVPFANRGDGFAGKRRSEVRVELRLVTPDGALRMSGRGSGRPKNVVSGTERVAATVIEKILAKAFAAVQRSQATAPTAPRPPGHAFKGYELYSWQDGGGSWRYALLEGTNRLKSPAEVATAGVAEDQLRLRLAELPQGESVSWCPPYAVETEVQLATPPEAVVTALLAYAHERELHLTVCDAGVGSQPPRNGPPTTAPRRLR